MSCPSSLAEVWLNRKPRFYVIVSITKIIQTTSDGLLCCLPQQSSGVELLQTSSSRWDTYRPWRKPHPGAGADFSEQRRSAGGSASFLGLFFFDSS